MTGPAGLVVCPQARIYDHGPEHPLRPQRVLHVVADRGVRSARALERLGLPCRAAEDAEIGLVHTDAFIEATKRAGHGEVGEWGRFGYGPGTTRSSRTCTRRARSSRARRSSPPRRYARGRCSRVQRGRRAAPRDAVACIGVLRVRRSRDRDRLAARARVHPIAYVDVDVHHGDGVQAIFYEDPRVLTVSLHQSGATLFRGRAS